VLVWWWWWLLLLVQFGRFNGTVDSWWWWCWCNERRRQGHRCRRRKIRHPSTQLVANSRPHQMGWLLLMLLLHQIVSALQRHLSNL
jgi:hypothetical protein